MNRYHCCATCKWYEVRKENNKKPSFHCVRLGYQTEPHYVFHCWNPKENVQKKMNKQREER
ncbi:hypothetical protein SAMN05192534_11053 [Alteribacillus persepolensis]|uniref:Uncharacterized protein n=1 Tax=Alteribacillus persepolensis TaxID=568899 RepID=A0A1G8ESW4_9BACI|nr:hypothetical protein [Alteribacillus persepolensis]SDH72956.1 hypothetical protein SAMN05192534_11053 [Alteribacillus persepolensis]